MDVFLYDNIGNVLYKTKVDLNRQYPNLPKYISWRGHMFSLGVEKADGGHYYETEQPHYVV